MISKSTVTSLQLPHYTIRNCQDLYDELAHSASHQALPLHEMLDKSGSDPHALNKLWWVLNYHAESLDRHRRHRAWLESRLEELAHDRKRHHPIEA